MENLKSNQLLIEREIELQHKEIIIECLNKGIVDKISESKDIYNMGAESIRMLKDLFEELDKYYYAKSYVELDINMLRREIVIRQEEVA